MPHQTGPKENIQKQQSGARGSLRPELTLGLSQEKQGKAGQVSRSGLASANGSGSCGLQAFPTDCYLPRVDGG
jgi:hypothetical protein